MITWSSLRQGLTRRIRGPCRIRQRHAECSPPFRRLFMRHWIRSLAFVSFIAAGCGASADVDTERSASVESALVKCAQTQVYAGVAVQWTHCNLARDPV